MKTKDQIIEDNRLGWNDRSGTWDIAIGDCMDEYAEEYAKAFIKFAEYEHEIKGLNAAFDEFRKPK
jgi:hypothetical protein